MSENKEKDQHSTAHETDGPAASGGAGSTGEAGGFYIREDRKGKPSDELIQEAKAKKQAEEDDKATEDDASNS